MRERGVKNPKKCADVFYGWYPIRLSNLKLLLFDIILTPKFKGSRYLVPNYLTIQILQFSSLDFPH